MRVGQERVGRFFLKKNPEIYINKNQYNIVIIITNTVV